MDSLLSMAMEVAGSIQWSTLGSIPSLASAQLDYSTPCDHEDRGLSIVFIAGLTCIAKSEKQVLLSTPLPGQESVGLKQRANDTSRYTFGRV
jgi:hypothetical protein